MTVNVSPYKMIYDEICRLYPDSQEKVIGETTVVYFKVSTPTHIFHRFILICDDQYIDIRARDEYSEALLQEIIIYLKSKDLISVRQNTLTVWSDFTSQHSSFSCIGILPPNISGCFANQSDILLNKGYWAFPLYSDDFKGNETAEEFEFDNGHKGRGVHVIDWNRKRDYQKANNTVQSTPES